MSMNTRLPNRPDDHLDRLFADYFRANMPANWPAPPRPWDEPVSPAAAPIAGDPATRSRWALAASVALLLGGCWYLGNHMSDGKPKHGLDLRGTEATPNHMKDLGKAPPKGP
jgi:hypothetical protein